MVKITSINNNANQIIQYQANDGSVVLLNLKYLANVQRWILNVNQSVTNFIVNGIGLSLNLNILREWREIIDYGIMIASENGFDPYKIDSFSSGECSFYILENSSEVQEIENSIQSS